MARRPGVSRPFRHEAIVQYRKTLELEPELSWVRAFLVDAYAEAGRLSEARAEILDVLRARNEPPARLEEVARLDPAEAIRRVRRRNAETRMREPRPDAEFVALRLAQLGEKDQAFAWLERACASRARWLVALLGSDPGFDGLRSDPRFSAYLLRVGLARPSAARSSD